MTKRMMKEKREGRKEGKEGGREGGRKRNRGESEYREHQSTLKGAPFRAKWRPRLVSKAWGWGT